MVFSQVDFLMLMVVVVVVVIHTSSHGISIGRSTTWRSSSWRPSPREYELGAPELEPVLPPPPGGLDPAGRIGAGSGGMSPG